MDGSVVQIDERLVQQEYLCFDLSEGSVEVDESFVEVDERLVQVDGAS